MSKLKFTKFHENAVLPKRANSHDAGMDMWAVSIRETDDYIEYGLGVGVEVPHNCVGLIFPRSSISKHSMALSNAVGVIDPFFHSEITARFRKLDTSQPRYSVGDRVCQLVIMPIHLMDAEWSEDLKGTRGSYGSTGK